MDKYKPMVAIDLDLSSQVKDHRLNNARIAVTKKAILDSFLNARLELASLIFNSATSSVVYGMSSNPEMLIFEIVLTF
jgi:hypothetical protein